ncbi:MAG TPA: DUF2062 domain-containing protein [Hydrogenophaga sp.]|uniref:DUF2062 domain-containing protein n=1 Tax=Hydrogenophaga sp. TaxID=1904254 RepID=UPI002D00F557|nr:DUF2062 domain-containing protein [Hydrogenophaga sp.]HMN93636.1 DUF2062 domain-containing protein [Hydrogenophaga sp.]HMP09523.1 DUF2062 domain-containing protein [Hydrogenophaga sp.]
MFKRLKGMLPSPESVRSNRWLRWLGPLMHHPKLWHFSRRGIAFGVAIGVFFGLLIPVAQIPFSVAVAVAMRANVPAAVASTLISNPVTYGPLWYGSYRLGKFVLGRETLPESEAMQLLSRAQEEAGKAEDSHGTIKRWFRQFGSVGKPLVLGMALMASVSGVAAFFLVSGIWVLRVRWVRSRRLKERGPVRVMERKARPDTPQNGEHP